MRIEGLYLRGAGEGNNQRYCLIVNSGPEDGLWVADEMVILCHAELVEGNNRNHKIEIIKSKRVSVVAQEEEEEERQSRLLHNINTSIDSFWLINRIKYF